MKQQSTETNEMTINGEYVSVKRMPIWVSSVPTTKFDRFYRRWVKELTELSMERDLRCQQEEYMMPISAESFEAAERAIDELKKQQMSMSITIDSIPQLVPPPPPDHNMNITDICNMNGNIALCKYWSDNNDKSSKRRKVNEDIKGSKRSSFKRNR